MIDALFTLFLKTTELLDLVLKAFRVDDHEVVDRSGVEVNKTVINLSKNNKSRNLMYVLNIKATKKPTFLNFNNKKAFNYLWLAFIKALIL